MSALATLAGGSLAALSPAAAGGKRRSHKKMRMVKKKTVRRMLKKMGMKMRGGAAAAAAGPGSVALDAPVADAVKEGAKAPEGGRRRGRSGKATRRRKFLGVF